MISFLEPKEKRLVYDLVREAGIDVSDWAKYKKTNEPQSNPKYCYNWSFFGPDHVVVCLWYEQMHQDHSGIFQELNYAEIPRGETGLRRRRYVSMNHALFAAFKKQLPVRVIIVHDTNRTDDKSLLKLRLLDPEPWHVVTYDDDGNCRLQRGQRRTNRAQIPTAGTKNAPRVSMIRFRAELENLKSHLLEHDGFPFESFTRGKIYDWENYKDFVFLEAGRRLNWEKWKSDEVGTGVILDRVIHAIEINEDAQRRNNLIKWQQYGAHKVLSEVRNDRRCFQVESLLFDFYRGELDAEDAFDPLVEDLGKKYPLIAYLFFIKDCSRYLPISPENFDTVFERLGVDLKTSGQCCWENYTAYLSVIREIRGLLEVEGFEGVRMLDAHSFCWLIASIDPPDETLTGAVAISEFDASSSKPFSGAGRDIDWEALHRARAALGRLGEELALAAEKNRLIKLGCTDLAQRVALVSGDHTMGYDLHSYEADGSDRLIEVKTMSEDGSVVKFYTSQRQLDLAHSGVNHFYYLVRGARSGEPRIQAIRASDIPSESILPIVHQVTWTEGEA